MSERSRFLAEACRGDGALRNEVESLLEQASAPGFLESPAFEAAARALAGGDEPMSEGEQIGSYTILSLIGKGGMGEVYRARDRKLGREVAVKVLPESLAGDPDRIARFRREAKILAALNHPNIAAIYGLEEADQSRALVMELVEGPTLEDRIAQGAIPVDEALPIAKQIAKALEAAHEQGIIHRDLKPANIKLRPDGVVKVLDFGLAKALEPTGAMAPDQSQSPTITTPAMTQPGMVLGTVAYMSPEQARGKPVDKRTDVWAFGCVLFEMLAGRSAFSRETTSDTIAAILGDEPDWRSLPDDVSTAVSQVLRRCLEKDRTRRLRDIGDGRLDLEDALTPPLSTSTSVAEHSQRTRWSSLGGVGRLAWVVGGVSMFVAVWGTASYLQRTDGSWQNPLEGARFTRLTNFDGVEEQASISRDGQFVTFVSNRNGPWDVWVGQLGTGEFQSLTLGRVPEPRNPGLRALSFTPDGALVTLWARLVDPTAGVSIAGWSIPTLGGQLRQYVKGAAELDWSSDGTRIAYHTNAPGDPLFVIDNDNRGGDPGPYIYSAPTGLHNHFPVWSPDGAFIYLVQGFPPDEMDVWRIPPTGGEPERLTFHESRVGFPTLLDPRTLLYIATDEDGAGPWLYGLDLIDRVPRRLVPGVDEYTSLSSTADGQRLVATISSSSTDLWRVPISDGVVGEDAATQIALPMTRGRSPRIAAGYLLYVVPGAGGDAVWRVGNSAAQELWSDQGSRVVGGPSVTADGTRIAWTAQKRGANRLYVMDADGTGIRTLAQDLNLRGSPAWSPDGQWIASAVDRGDGPRLMRIPMDDSAPMLVADEFALDPIWTSTGEALVYSGADVGTSFSVHAVGTEGTPLPFPEIALTRGARRLSFLPGGTKLVVLKGNVLSKNFWLVDLQSGREQQLTSFGPQFLITDFDVSADGREIVFDRVREESDLVLIERRRP